MSTISPTFSTVTGFDAAGRPVVQTDGQGVRAGLAERIAQLFAWIATAPQRARHNAELAAMTDRDLADIGLSRENIGRIHDPDFAADFAAARNARSSLKWL